MPARLAFPFLYTECVRHADEDARLQIDALLGDRSAAVEMNERRSAAALAMDADIG